MRRLDDILRGEGIAHVDVVKVSANGGELAALRGMEVILRRDRPALLVDLTAVADNATGFESSDLYAFLAKLGYQIESLPAEPPAEPNEATGELGEVAPDGKRFTLLTVSEARLLASSHEATSRRAVPVASQHRLTQELTSDARSQGL